MSLTTSTVGCSSPWFGDVGDAEAAAGAEGDRAQARQTAPVPV
jgi:hypothetical protein